MNLHLHIERLVLHGLPLDARDVPQLQAAVERELARLLGESSLAAGFHTSATLASLHGGSIQWTGGVSAATLGAQLGAAVYGGLERQP